MLIMRKQKNDFAQHSSNENTFYDLREDWVLVEASIATQYGIRIRENSDMPFDEFLMLIGGLMSETPLGQIVSIRSETDRKVIKEFSPGNRKIYNDWKLKIANSKIDNPEKLNNDIDAIANTLKKMFFKQEGGI